MPDRIEVPPPTQPKEFRVISRIGWIGACVAGVLLLGLLVVGARWAQAESKRAACRGQLRSLSIAMHLYTGDNDGAFHENLGQLYAQNYTDNPKIFSCPARPSSYLDYKSGTVSERSASYACVPGLTSGMPGLFILAYEKSPDNHRNGRLSGGRNVLYIDTRVVFWPESREAELQRRLALQADTVAKWRASGKPVEAIGEFFSPELWKLMVEKPGIPATLRSFNPTPPAPRPGE